MRAAGSLGSAAVVLACSACLSGWSERLGSTMRAVEGELLLSPSPWSPDGQRLVVAEVAKRRLLVFAADGSDLRALEPENDAEIVFPVWSPDGTRIVYLATDGDEDARLVTVTCAGAVVSDVPAPAWPFEWTADEWLLGYSPESEDELRIVRLRPDGTQLDAVGDGFWAAWSPATESLAWVAAGGRGGIEVSTPGTGVRKELGAGSTPSWSPDGDRLVCADRDEIVTIDVSTAERQRIACDGVFPRWSPNGDRILFTSVDGAEPRLVTVRPDGSEPLLLADAAFAGRWSPDGSQVAFLRGGDPFQLVVVDADGRAERVLGSVAACARTEPR